MLRARRLRGVSTIVGGIAGVAVFSFGAFHLVDAFSGESTIVSAVYLASVVVLVVQFLAAQIERPYRVDDDQRAALDALDVVVLVPCYNEDPEALRRCLQSFFDQSRHPQGICVTDDGSSTSEYPEQRDWFLSEAERLGIRAHWRRTPNGGKRVAQIMGARREPKADIYVTVDSDSILDPEALAEGLKPFAHERIQSVAAVILTTNYGTNLLTRMMDLICVTLQLGDRSALSSAGSVMVNCGGCALYRGDILRANVRTYLTETLFGRPVHMSDDSLLTLFALERGFAVQQPSAFAFTLMPEKVEHHVRQQLRWMRGSFIRSWWRFKYIPMTHPAYWVHAVKWVMYLCITAVFLALLFSGVLLDPVVFGWAILVTIGVQFATSARYLSVWRSDQTVGQRWLVYLTAPVAAMWSWFVLRVLRWYAMATFRNVAWGTRKQIEVSVTAEHVASDADRGVVAAHMRETVAV